MNNDLIKKVVIIMGVIFVIAIVTFIFSFKRGENNEQEKIKGDEKAKVEESFENENKVDISDKEPGDLKDEDGDVIQKNDFTEEQLNEYYAVYDNPFVKQVRVAFNGYLDGTNKGISAPEVVIDGLSGDKASTSGLKNYKDYLDGKFIVLYLDNALFGGMNVVIMFQEKPDKIFTAWVYDMGDGSYDLRGFWENSDITKKEIEEHVRRYKVFIEDKEHSL